MLLLFWQNSKLYLERPVRFGKLSVLIATNAVPRH